MKTKSRYFLITPRFMQAYLENIVGKRDSDILQMSSVMTTRHRIFSYGVGI